jgi:chromosome segregation ATPase
MTEQAFSFEEFEREANEELVPEEIDVQKAVVESLAEEKILLEDKLKNFENKINDLAAEAENYKNEITSKNAEIEDLKLKLSQAVSSLDSLKIDYDKLSKEFSLQEENNFEVKSRNPNQLALLDRDVELPDRFPGETRDFVIDVIREAYNKAEQEGRIRLAQVLESVLVNNEPNGLLLKRKTCLQELFVQKMNIVNGVVIEKLKEMGISYRKGEEYLSAAEIMARNF